ncbi:MULTISPECIES: carbamoyltransferase family protein [Mycolicibacter]|uniref:Carbamoyltransferase n=1 Tax=Mycolicibacter virginiensis TaxID=1795032 RepID=A0A9X7NYN6_9MYCO|nr:MULTISPECIES: carbamoyltransferase C-terminal domain-containing protein [Mycobacteriaceae]OBJ29845.1 carbamoyltransferase [Mycolicibacter heraklionensis]PQM52195.1 carbamoyltransferase [Mycolicibacter virginiensis]ULP46581.1 carbamoyltransferase [Mycolicibacter virginiensis]
MRVLGINAVFHDPAAALVIDGRIVAAAEEERFSRRKHGKQAVAFSTWELPIQAARWCLAQGGIGPADLDAVGYSYDPALAGGSARLDVGEAKLGPPHEHSSDVIEGQDRDWEYLRTLYARRAPLFLAAALPGLDPGVVRHVRHHVAHAASAGLASPFDDSAVLVVDGRGEATSMLAGEYRDQKLDVLASQALPHSLGLLYEELTEHLGFTRSGDEYKVMAMASYGKPVYAERLRELVYACPDGTFRTSGVDWCAFTRPRGRGEQVLNPAHADLACSVQTVLEEVLADTVAWLARHTKSDNLCLAGGVALNCVANTALFDRGDFSAIWVQPAAGDSGTALGAALAVAAEHGETISPMASASLGRSFTDDEIAAELAEADIRYERPDDIAVAVAEILGGDGVVGWFQGRSEFGPRALGNRSLLADPRQADNLERLNRVKGREQFRPVAPMVLAERAGEIFTRGPLPSPYMLFVHDVTDMWRDRIPAATHVDGTARIQTVGADDPLLHRMISVFAERTGVPVVVNTSFNTAGRPMVDSPRDALECFGSAPIDALALGPFLIRRHAQ